MEFNELFWNASIHDMKNGYVYDKDSQKYICLCCGKSFEEGIIYNNNNILMDAKKTINKHIIEDHHSIYEFLVNMDKKYTGITENQKSLMNLFYQGESDKAIANQTNSSASTIRNQRFSLRERAKQAKIFLTIMDLLEEKMAHNDHLVPIHLSATNIDERYAITESEKETFIDKYIQNGKLLSFPKKQKRIIVILQYIITYFEENRKYKETEVNDILRGFYDDYVTIRRYLIEYGFLERTPDGHEYWRKL